MLIVKKFGGSSVADKECIFRVAERCAEDYKSGHDVIVVLSAMGESIQERDGYVVDNRGTDFRITDGDGIP